MAFRLPPECVGLILDHLEFSEDKFSPSALYRALTVNKEFFHQCVRKLYQDPLRTITACRDEREAFRRFLRLVAGISPSQNEILEIDRATFAKGLPPTPTVDYLDYVTIMRYRPVIEGVFSGFDLWEFWEALVDVVCGHNLSRIRSISVFSEHIEDLLERAHQLRSIEEIEIILFEAGANRESLHMARELATRLLHIQHGQKSQGHSSPPNHPGRTVPLDIRLKGCQSEVDWQALRSELKELFAVLPRSTAAVVSSAYGEANLVRFCLMPESFDLSAVKVIEQWDPRPSHQLTNWDEADSVTTEKMLSLVQQCRSLKALTLPLDLNAVDPFEGTDPFEWAVKERQEALAAAKEGRSSSRPLIQLQHLELHFHEETERSVRGIIESATFGFGSTLRSLCLDLCSDPASYHFRDLPELRRLVVHWPNSQSPDHLMITRCPKLEHFDLSDNGDDGNDGDYGDYGDYDDYADNMFSWNNFGAARGSKSLAKNSSYTPWKLPSLRSLTLFGDATWKFSQASWMSMLDSLVTMSLGTQCITTDFCDDIPMFTWSGWPSTPFSELQELELTGAPAMTFQLSMLIQCPVIDRVVLDVLRYAEQTPRLEARIGDIALLRQHPLPLKKLAVRGIWHVSDEFLLRTLPIICPNLRELEVTRREDHSGNLVSRIKAQFEHLNVVHLSSKPYDREVAHPRFYY
ncbi:hypothetical protein DFQ26_006822 [Actinomortierella ambigua]|nr:hypothetical protein DFQ26_006822 [Actinomortierella ambigua]